MEEMKLRILDLAREYNQKRRDIIAIALECGELLTKAKAQTPHSEWGRYLEGVDLNDRMARQWMQLADFGLNADTVEHLGGIRATLENLRPRKGASNKEIALQMELLEVLREEQDIRARIAEKESEIAELVGDVMPDRYARFNRQQAQIKELKGDNTKLRTDTNDLQQEHNKVLKKIKEAEVA